MYKVTELNGELVGLDNEGFWDYLVEVLRSRGANSDDISGIKEDISMLKNNETYIVQFDGSEVFTVNKDEEVIQITIRDDEGVHILQKNSYVVKCILCGKERDLLESDIVGGSIIKPNRCDCGGENQFRYWLDTGSSITITTKK